MGHLTIVIPTYNRAPLLRRALQAVMAQRAPRAPIAIVVVDNNSTDDTPSAVAEAAAADPRIHYVREPLQGLSYARNAGIRHADRLHAAAAGPARHQAIIAFTDDDVEVSTDWASGMLREFEDHPEADCVGGRVLPRWSGPPPAWLTRDHWAPLALQDHGDAPRLFDLREPVCLIGANVAFRRDVFDRVGLFSPDVQRVRDGVGSTEDHELLRRLYAAGGRARYAPAVVATAAVPPERLSRGYHRRWHRGHGRFHAVMRTPEMERARARVLGVPVHLFRTAGADALAWVRLRLSGDAARAFAAETRLWFFSGYLRERCPCLPRR